MKPSARVMLGEDYIAIRDDKGEIVYWDILEWKEDPYLVFTIVNAIAMVYRGEDLRKAIASTK